MAILAARQILRCAHRQSRKSLRTDASSASSWALVLVRFNQRSQFPSMTVYPRWEAGALDVTPGLLKPEPAAIIRDISPFLSLQARHISVADIRGIAVFCGRSDTIGTDRCGRRYSGPARR